MSRHRPTPGIADYVVIAITPALIMLLVGSLVFFLLTTMYDGNFGGRLRYVAALFIFAAVLVARISIEEGTEHALLFGFPLAGATLLALLRFTDASLLVVVGITALIWWAAHQLTWDCTVLDESREVSGGGLLASAGFSSRDATSETDPYADAGTGIAPVPETRDDRPGASLNGWWHWWLARQRRPHDPGVGVVYFVLATLPLIAIGQLLLDSADLSLRRAAFRCLLCYVASGLALLTTTSFLGIRRYLRRRALAMPTEMAGRWIAMAAALIVAILMLCCLLPRPQPEYGLAHLGLGSPASPRANRFAPLQDGGAPKQEGSVIDSQDKEGQRTMAGDDTSQDERSPGQNQVAAGNADASPSSAEARDPRDSADAGQTSTRPPDDAQRQAGSPAHNLEAGDPETVRASPAQNEPSRQAAGENARTTSQRPRRAAGDGSRAQQPRPPAVTTAKRFEQLPKMLGQGLLTLLRWIYWAIVAAGVAFVLIRYWRVILAAAHKFWLDVLSLLATLWGGRRGKPHLAVAEVAQPAEKLARPFASSSNPFASHRQLTAGQLVLYTFTALEAWGRERNCPRSPHQTAFEFARRVGRAYPDMSSTTKYLADLYGRAMFAPDDLDRVSTVQLKCLWEQMTEPSSRRET